MEDIFIWYMIRHNADICVINLNYSRISRYSYSIVVIYIAAIYETTGHTFF